MTSFGLFIVNFEHIPPFSSASIADFEQLNVNWVTNLKQETDCRTNLQKDFPRSIFIIGGVV